VAPPSIVVARAPQRASCDDCAFVESVRLVEPVPGGPIGAVAGAIAGAVLGKELGEAHHRRMLAFLGALGGAFAGHEIGKQATQQRAQYDVVVRTRDGRSQTLRLDHAPSFSPGDTVRLRALRGEALPAPL
jgi:outer membrane lipoprotein SlyB